MSAGQGGAGQAGQAGAGGNQAGAGGNQAGAGGSQAGAGGSQAGAGGQAGASAGVGGSGSKAGASGTGGAGQSGAGQSGAGQGGSGAGTAGAGGEAGQGGDSGQGGAGGAGEGGAGGESGASGQGGGSEPPTCIEPQFLCGNACVDEGLEHCGGCDPCLIDDHASNSCESGECFFTCNVGFADVAARCRDFGGWYLTYTEVLGAVYRVAVGNGLNNGDDSCPAGFNKKSNGAIPLNEVGLDVNNVELSLCIPKDILSNPSSTKGDFGGVYLKNSSGGCDYKNPYRSDGQCGCPTSGNWRAQEIEVFSKPGDLVRKLGVCSREGVEAPTFGGIYAKYIDPEVVTLFNGKNCIEPFPGTELCDCPQGFFGVPMETRSKGTKNGNVGLHGAAFVACIPDGL